MTDELCKTCDLNTNPSCSVFSFCPNETEQNTVPEPVKPKYKYVPPQLIKYNSELTTLEAVLDHLETLKKVVDYLTQDTDDFSNTLNTLMEEENK